MARLRRRLLLACALLLPCAAPARAQHSLVLSGGGSRGLAHAGVIVGLDRLGYSPPLVVGTSMGAVIGALYAAGYAPAEIWDIVARQDWVDLFAADPFPVGPDREPRRPMLSIGFAQTRDEPVLEGFVAQSGINRKLTQLLFDAGARAHNDFDQLPRRFRAVTTDLRTGGEYVIARGDLARAVRASMAVPGAFAPVRWQEHVLVDGGIANNLGVNVARALAPLPVIGVDVVRPAGELEESSALHIGLRAVRLLLHNTRHGRDSAEVLVVPRIDPGYPETRFPEDAGMLLLAGYEAAVSQLSARTVPIEPLPPANAPPTRIDAVEVEGVSGAVATLVERTFARVLGAYDPAQVLERVDALYSTGMFHGVWPRMERRAEGRSVLVVRAEPISAAVVTGALGWNSDVGPRIWSAVRTRTVLVSPLEARVAVSYDQLDRFVSASGTFYSTIAPPLTWLGGGHWRQRRVRQFEADEITAEQSVQRFGLWAGIEWRSLRRQEGVSLALRAEEVRVDQPLTDGLRPADFRVDGFSVGPYLRYAAFPHTDVAVGMDEVLEAEARFGRFEYARVHAAGSARFRSEVMQAALVGRVTLVSSDAPSDVQPWLGGAGGAPWLREGEQRDRSVALVGADVAYPLLPGGRLRVRLRTGAASAGLTQLRDARWLHGIEIGGVWNTALGPVTAGLASGTDNAWRLNLAAGSSW